MSGYWMCGSASCKDGKTLVFDFGNKGTIEIDCVSRGYACCCSYGGKAWCCDTLSYCTGGGPQQSTTTANKQQCPNTGALSCQDPLECTRMGGKCKNEYVCSSGFCCCDTSGGGGQTCTDTDNGKNYNVKGTCTDNSGSHPDSCVGNNKVREWYCDNGVCKYEDHICDNGCSEGACQGGEEKYCSSVSGADDYVLVGIDGTSKCYHATSYYENCPKESCMKLKQDHLWDENRKNVIKILRRLE